MKRHRLWLWMAALGLTLVSGRPAAAATKEEEALASLQRAIRLRVALVKPDDLGKAWSEAVSKEAAAKFLCPDQAPEIVEPKGSCAQAGLRIFPDGRFDKPADQAVGSFCLQDVAGDPKGEPKQEWVGPIVVRLDTDSGASPSSRCFLAQKNQLYTLDFKGGVSAAVQLRLFARQGAESRRRGPSAYAPQALKAAEEEAQRQFRLYVLQRWQALVLNQGAEHDAAALATWRRVRAIAVRRSLASAAESAAALEKWAGEQDAALKAARAAAEAEQDAARKRPLEEELKKLQTWVPPLLLKLKQARQSGQEAERLMSDERQPRLAETKARVDSALTLIDEGRALILSAAVPPPSLGAQKDALQGAQEALTALSLVSAKAGHLAWPDLVPVLQDLVNLDLAQKAEGLQSAEVSQQAWKRFLEQVVDQDTRRRVVAELALDLIDDKLVSATLDKYLRGTLAADVPSPDRLIQGTAASEASYQRALRRLASSHQPVSVDGGGLPWLIFEGSVPLASDALSAEDRPSVYALSPQQGTRRKRESFVRDYRAQLFGYNLRRPQRPAPDAAATTAGAPPEVPGDELAILAEDIPRATELAKLVNALFIVADTAMGMGFGSAGKAEEGVAPAVLAVSGTACGDLLKTQDGSTSIIEDAEAPERDLRYSSSPFTSRVQTQLLTSTDPINGTSSEGTRYRLVICSGVKTCSLGSKTALSAITAEALIDVLKPHRWFGVLTELAYFQNRGTDEHGGRGLPLGGYRYEPIGGLGGSTRLYELRGDYALANHFAFSALVAVYPLSRAVAGCRSSSGRRLEGLALAFGPTFARTNGGEFGKQWNFRIGYELGRSSVLLLAGLALRRIDVPVYQKEGQVISLSAAPTADDLKFATEQRSELLFSIGLGLDLAVLSDALQLLRSTFKEKKMLLPDNAGGGSSAH